MDFGVVVIAVVAGHGRGIAWRADKRSAIQSVAGSSSMALAPDRSGALLVYSPACAPAPVGQFGVGAGVAKSDDVFPRRS